jgi:hypothetical protein
MLSTTADVAAEWEGEVGRIVAVDRFEPGFHPLRVVGVGGEGDLLDGLVRGACSILCPATA